MKSPLSASTECVNLRNRYFVIILHVQRTHRKSIDRLHLCSCFSTNLGRGAQSRSARIQSGDFVSALHVMREPSLNAQEPGLSRSGLLTAFCCMAVGQAHAGADAANQSPEFREAGKQGISDFGKERNVVGEQRNAHHNEQYSL